MTVAVSKRLHRDSLNYLENCLDNGVHFTITPLRLGNLLADGLANLPIQIDQRGVDRLHRAQACSHNPLRYFGEISRQRFQRGQWGKGWGHGLWGLIGV